MTQITQHSFLVSGIMCFEGCGKTIKASLEECLDQYKKEGRLPPSAQLVLDAEPQSIGIHRLFITITADEPVSENYDFAPLYQDLKKSIPEIFALLENDPTTLKESASTNWINIFINLLSISSIIALSIIFPPSVLLTVGLTTLSFATTAFTARNYLIPFFQNFKTQNLTNMSTTVSWGWLLSLAHTLYHSVTMPLANSFSMIFMSFIMPVMLITVINGMDEIKRKIMQHSKKMHLQGIGKLFPQMANTYSCYQPPQLSTVEQITLDSILNEKPISDEAFKLEEFFNVVEKIINHNQQIEQSKQILKKRMILKIKRGECFPVDCTLVRGKTVVDSSLLTGEHQQEKQCLDFIPAGAINLSEEVIVIARADSYHSTINQLLFPSNREKITTTSEPGNTFNYFYTFLIIIGIIASIAVPFSLGILTFSLSLQNLTGILFAVCPCTIAMARELPRLINIYHRGNKGIIINDERLGEQVNEMHTIIFDKTGTLTTGNSQVTSSEGEITKDIWQRIYLLEKHHGAEHPLAKAITRHYENQYNVDSIMIQNIEEAATDPNHCGLSAKVQGVKINIGNEAYLKSKGISMPHLEASKTESGITPVYIAEEGIYKGVIYIKHEIHKETLDALKRLKREGKTIIMLTGDNQASALGFNKQNDDIFDIENIYAEQNPSDKDRRIEEIMNNSDQNPAGFWYIGDGLNDAPCIRRITEKGGVSCAMHADDKTSFFADINLNGSLNYLFEHNKLNQFLQNNILQNKILLIYSTVAFLAFIMSFSIVGIAVSPLIPLLIMTSTTLLILFNSYRMQLAIDCALDPGSSWLKQFLASDASIGLLSGTSLLFMSSLLLATIATGGFAFPIFAFTTAAVAISSMCLLTAGILLSSFTVLACAYFFIDTPVEVTATIEPDVPTPMPPKKIDSLQPSPKNTTSNLFSIPKLEALDTTAEPLVTSTCG